MVNDIKISENFTLREFQCKDGSNLVMIDPDLLKKLQALRTATGRPIHINSGYRTPEYNKMVGGVKESQHMYGRAADITIEGMTPKEVAVLAEMVGFTGIGIYKSFTHVDVRPIKTHWNG